MKYLLPGSSSNRGLTTERADRLRRYLGNRDWPEGKEFLDLGRILPIGRSKVLQFDKKTGPEVILHGLIRSDLEMPVSAPDAPRSRPIVPPSGRPPMELIVALRSGHTPQPPAPRQPGPEFMVASSAQWEKWRGSTDGFPRFGMPTQPLLEPSSKQPPALITIYPPKSEK